MTPDRHEYLRALAGECLTTARWLRIGSILAYLAIFCCVYTDLPGWAIAMGCFAIAFEFLRAIALRDHRCFRDYLTDEEP